MDYGDAGQTEKVSTCLFLPTFATQVQWWWMFVYFNVFIFFDYLLSFFF